MSSGWRVHLEHYLAEYTEGGVVVGSRQVGADMARILFRDPSHAVKAVALSGHRITTSIEMRVSLILRIELIMLRLCFYVTFSGRKSCQEKKRL